MNLKNINSWACNVACTIQINLIDFYDIVIEIINLGS